MAISQQGVHIAGKAVHRVQHVHVQRLLQSMDCPILRMHHVRTHNQQARGHTIRATLQTPPATTPLCRPQTKALGCTNARSSLCTTRLQRGRPPATLRSLPRQRLARTESWRPSHQFCPRRSTMLHLQRPFPLMLVCTEHQSFFLSRNIG